MLKRQLKALLEKRLALFPAVLLTGPRQAGKTTLAHELSNIYFDLEQEHDRLRLDLQWETICRNRNLVVLDEAQAWPLIFPRLRGAIDQDRKRNGRFLLLGSVSPALMINISESLAGRLSVCELTPLLLNELQLSQSQEQLWLNGGYPDGGILNPGQFPIWQNDYLNLLAQRDLPSWGLPAKPQTTLRLFKMIAHMHGQLWNASQMGRSLGLSYHTVNSYMERLTNAYLIRLLAPYHANLGKRLVKSPKIYWRDSGLLHALLGVSDEKNLLTQPWVGASWQGWVVEQIIAHLLERGIPHEAFHFRTKTAEELDLLLEVARERWAIEIKLTSFPAPEDFKKLNQTADLAKAGRRVLLSKTKTVVRSGNMISASLSDFLPILIESAV
ncbi:MAG: ATP-binding protein [Elusimicrobia bacterium]|nr:ATP-binding protein [Elusimicrobiota bacterium]